MSRLIQTASSATSDAPLDDARGPRHRVGRRPSTPAVSSGSSNAARAFPEDLLRDASRRLEIMALLAAALWLILDLAYKFAYRAISPANSPWLTLRGPDGVALVSIVVSLGFFAYARRATRNPELVLDHGLVYQVYTALAIGLIAHWGPARHGMPTPEISWVGIVVLASAAIVPRPPRKTLIAGLIAVSMNPISMLISKARGQWDFGPDANAFLMHFPDYLLVGVAVVISRTVTKLGHHVAKARQMGSYELGELLGSGGMGEVYKATHRMLARPAAIKLMRATPRDGSADGGAGDLALARFRREAEAAAKLRSPHTVELYDFGVTDDDSLYFVMELLDGMDLETLVRQHGPMPANRAVWVLRQVCESLEEAHAVGLVHRDIKPANIHVGRLGLEYDFVKVLDFGLVKTIGGTGDDKLLETAAGLTPGTPSYMAPEAVLGDPVDGRADLYALGCVAYFLLTGRPVFEAVNAMQMTAKHLRAEPAPPSRYATQPVPAALDAAVLACLAKRPDDRPRDAHQLSLMLAAVELEPWTQEQARAWWASISQGGDT